MTYDSGHRPVNELIVELTTRDEAKFLPDRCAAFLKGLDAAGYAIVPKEPDIRMMQAGVHAWRAKHDSQVYAEPLAEACYVAMLECARRNNGEATFMTDGEPKS